MGSAFFSFLYNGFQLLLVIVVPKSEFNLIFESIAF